MRKKNKSMKTKLEIELNKRNTNLRVAEGSIKMGNQKLLDALFRKSISREIGEKKIQQCY